MTASQLPSVIRHLTTVGMWHNDMQHLLNYYHQGSNRHLQVYLVRHAVLFGILRQPTQSQQCILEMLNTCDI